MITKRIKEILSEFLDFPIDEIKMGSSLKNDLGLDSFDSLRIIFEVEDEFNIKVPPTEVLGIKTVGDIANYISKRLSMISE